MRKRVAEKVLSRAILALAVYPKHTMAKALKRRPKFWTESLPPSERANEPTHKQRRLKFDDEGVSRFTVEYDFAALERHEALTSANRAERVGEDR